jgi:hypothetical protein
MFRIPILKEYQAAVLQKAYLANTLNSVTDLAEALGDKKGCF